MDFLSSNSLTMMEKSMGFLWTKQAAILDNIANAETPNYKAKVVTFEESFREKLDAALSSQTPRKNAAQVLENEQVYVTEAQESTRMDDNGVNVTEQSTEMVRNAYQLQYVMSAISSDLNTLRTAIKGQ
jgi:flagellar basal-body rod protein FlgB